MKQAVIYHKIVPSPNKPNHLPTTIKWLSGEGCGSWFNIEKQDKGYIISRFSPEGKLECRGLFNQVSGQSINFNEEYEYTYLSHCAEVNIIQNNNTLTFKLISKNI
ncbi:MAG: hypothetical protein Q8M29_17010 [Bacteroidota bacterium]|nr:hypothetical protein [Bacteroidota bacterium]